MAFKGMARRAASAAATLVGPDLAGIYGRAVRQDASTRNPVVLIPGVMGSRLSMPGGGPSMWGGPERVGGFADSQFPEQARAIAHPMGEDAATLSEFSRNLEPDGTMGKVRGRAWGLPVAVRAYEQILTLMGVGGYLNPEGNPARSVLDYGPDVIGTCFEFDYDWRRTVPDNAARLGRLIDLVTNWLEVEADCGRPVKVDVVAHSMGGVVLRYFLRYGQQGLPASGKPKLDWSGAKKVEHVLMVGTPNAGSLTAMERLQVGLPKTPVYPGYSPAIVASMPALYQLMTRTRHKRLVDRNGAALDAFDPELWIDRRWGLADPNADATLRVLMPDVDTADARRRVAMEHLERCLTEARRVHDLLDFAADSPDDLVMQLFAGDGIPTPAVARPTAAGRGLEPVSFDPGDATVTRASALMDERLGQEDPSPRLLTPIRYDAVTFLPTDHMALTRHPTFIDNALYLLLEKPRPSCGYRQPAPQTTGLGD